MATKKQLKAELERNWPVGKVEIVEVKRSKEFQADFVFYKRVSNAGTEFRVWAKPHDPTIAGGFDLTTRFDYRRE